MSWRFETEANIERASHGYTITPSRRSSEQAVISFKEISSQVDHVSTSCYGVQNWVSNCDQAGSRRGMYIIYWSALAYLQPSLGGIVLLRRVREIKFIG